MGGDGQTFSFFSSILLRLLDCLVGGCLCFVLAGPITTAQHGKKKATCDPGQGGRKTHLPSISGTHDSMDTMGGGRNNPQLTPSPSVVLA